MFKIKDGVWGGGGWIGGGGYGLFVFVGSGLVRIFDVLGSYILDYIIFFLLLGFGFRYFDLWSD